MCGGTGPTLLAGVEDPGLAEPRVPRAALDPRRLVDVAAQHDVRPVLVDPAGEVVVGELAAAVVAEHGARPAASGRARSSARGGRLRRLGELVGDGLPVAGPSHHGQMVNRVPSTSTDVPSTWMRSSPAACSHAGHLLAVRARAVEVVVAGRRQHRSPSPPSRPRYFSSTTTCTVNGTALTTSARSPTRATTSTSSAAFTSQS